jgi:hypothetical protein
MARNVVIDIEEPRPPSRPSGGIGLIGWMFALLLLLGSARSIATFYIDWEWWKEVGQSQTFGEMIRFAILPRLLVGALTGSLFFFLSARHGSNWIRRAFVSLVAGYLLTVLLIDNWTIVRWWGGTSATAPSAWRDPVFGHDLGYYFYALPFFQMALRWLMAVVLISGVYYLVRHQFQNFRGKFSDLQNQQWQDLDRIDVAGLFSSMPLRALAAALLVIFAAQVWLARYDFLFADHGFMVGADYVAVNVGLPLVYAKLGATLLAAALVVAGRWLWAGGLLILTFAASGFIPSVVNALNVRPNEISLQRPFIVQHIEATRAAYGLNTKLKERDFPARQNGAFAPAEHKELLENVRLWDWKAFHDTVTQIQALRPYYVFADTDVDRYKFPDGRTRQVLLTPRELDVRQLPEARSRWINPHFIYTHGYGVVMAEANKISGDGLPQLLLKDAPLTANSGAPNVTRPEIYYGEAVHEPVFVRTAQPEFNYPAGTENVHSKYEGGGGIAISGFPMRLAAAIAEGDWNILLTSYLSAESRMLIRRNVLKRVDTLAEFVVWDEDPYLVITGEGRLVWMIDGYTTHNRHPFSKSLRAGFGSFNYMRNSVKATVDAYDGRTQLYAWDDSDPILNAYRAIFPQLFAPASSMPATLRAHARYPELQFRVQAEIYLTYHMRDPEAFYNKEDVWDIAKTGSAADAVSEASKPTYLMATLPGDKQAEFLLLTTFTPRNKQNLIGLMAARCDGNRLGEIEVLQLSKQQLIYGPMQVSARINQDQNISKDLTLWNQQGSSVIKGQMLVLPMADQFLYVEPIYIQAAKAPMPELKKVALGFGSTIAYADTYEQALSQLAGQAVSLAPDETPAAPQPVEAKTPQTAVSGDPRLERVRGHLRRYRELSAQGRFVDAARELEQMEQALKQ